LGNKKEKLYISRIIYPKTFDGFVYQEMDLALVIGVLAIEHPLHTCVWSITCNLL